MLSTSSRSLMRAAGRRCDAATKLRATTLQPDSLHARLGAAAVVVVDRRFLHYTDLSMRDEDERKLRRSAAYLYIQTVPRISVPLPQSSHRWKSTTTTTTAAKGEDSEKESSAKPAGKGDATDPTMREKLRARLKDSRDSAVEHYRDFREHPRESAKVGAKTVSAMFQKYGPVFVFTYGSVYFSTLGLLFVGVQSGILDPVVLFGWLGQESSSETTVSTVRLVVDFMESHDFTRRFAGVVEKNPAFANLAVAWIAVKFTEPVRLPVALALTPRVSRFLGYTREAEDEPEKPKGTEKSANAAAAAASASSSSVESAPPESTTKDDSPVRPSAGTKP